MHVSSLGSFCQVLLLTASFCAAASSDFVVKKRDAYTLFKPVDNTISLSSVGSAPTAANGRAFKVTSKNGGSGNIFTWFGSVGSEARATSAMIVVHGMDRNAGPYFTEMHKVLKAHSDSDTILVAPSFFSSRNDRRAMNESTLGWGDSNAWQAGEGSTSPSGSRISSFTVLDHFLDMFSDQSRYPNMK